MKPSPKDEAEILATLDQYSREYSRESAAHDLDGILSGFAEIDAPTITWTWRQVSVQGATSAWVAADASVAVTVQGQELHFPLRMTIVLERRAGAWKWVHHHAAVPNARQATDMSSSTEHP